MFFLKGKSGKTYGLLSVTFRSWGLPLRIEVWSGFPKQLVVGLFCLKVIFYLPPHNFGLPPHNFGLKRTAGHHG